MDTARDITFDVSQTPFSRYGSYYTIAYRDQADLPSGAGSTFARCTDRVS